MGGKAALPRQRVAQALPAALLTVLLAGLLAVAGCGSPPGPSVPPPAPATPVDTPDGYQSMLNQTDDQLAAAFTAIGQARSLEALEQTVLEGAGAASAASERLTTSGPVPASVSGDNAALAAGLRQFGRELAYLSQQINQRAICAGPTALTAISTAPAMPDLRVVGTQLGTPHSDRPAYRWGRALPPPHDAVHSQLHNGALLVDRRAGAGGDGVLRVRNNATKDAVLLLAKAGAVVVSMAVNAGQSARLDGVPDGDYDLYYTLGQDWDAGLTTFSRHCEFHRFTTPTSFSTRPVTGGSAYTVQSIVLTGQDDSPGATGPDPAAAPGGRPDTPNQDGPPASGGQLGAGPGTTEVDPGELPR
jgi:hypothetical protein